MFDTVLPYMEEHRAIWHGTKAIGDTVAALRDKIDLIMEAVQRQAATGLTQARNQVRQKLELSLLEMANQLEVLAVVTKDAPLAAQSRFTPTLLGDLTCDALETAGHQIRGLLHRHLAVLADFDVTAADVAALEELLEEYREMKAAQREVIAGRIRETMALEPLIRDTAHLLRHQLDKLVTRFRHTHPAFVAGYESARMVIRRRSKTRAPRRTSAITAAKPPAAAVLLVAPQPVEVSAASASSQPAESQIEIREKVDQKVASGLEGASPRRT